MNGKLIIRQLFFAATAALMLASTCKVSEDKLQKKHSSTLKKEDVEKKLTEKNKYVIVSYNVENLFDTIDDPGTKDEEFTPEGYKHWTKERYEKKIKHLSWAISNISDDELPAVVGLCEVEHKSVVRDLADSRLLKNGKYKIVHEEGPDTRGIDIALMYRPGMFEVVNYEIIPVVMPSEPDVKLRNILHVTGHFADGETFHFFVNHWKSRRDGLEDTEYKRTETAKILRNTCNNIFSKNKNANIVIMGDFNDEPKSKSLNKVLRATNNEKNPTFDEFYNLLYNKSLKGEGTNSRDYRWYMLDNLIVSQNLRKGQKYYAEEGQIFKSDKILYYNAKANFRVPNKTYGGKNYYGGYSDHLPVYFILKRIDN